MKEKWVNKLIKLLNEYDDWMVSWFKEYVEEFGVFILNTEQMMEEEIIISKSFGFIKWLVDNDKIDLERILKENWQFRLFYYDLERVKNYDRLVMYLSVEDNPIEFLISILK